MTQNWRASSAAGSAARYVDHTYADRNPDWHHSHAPWKAQQVLRMLDDHGLRPRSVCDVGCGTAGVLRELRRHLPEDTELVGFEPSADAIQLGEAAGGVRIVHGDGHDSAERFDLCLMLDVIEHVESPWDFLRSHASRADRFLFHIPLDMSVQSVLRMSPLLQAREKVGHLHYFSRETALALVAESGFVVDDHQFTLGSVEVPGRSRAQRAAGAVRGTVYRVRPHFAARVLGGFSLLVLARPEWAAITDEDRPLRPR